MSTKEIAITMLLALAAIAIAIRVEAVRKAIGLPPVSTV
jgi:hypothetical protein